MLITSVMPSAAKPASSASTSFLADGSRLAVGSSRNRMSGRTAQPRASARRCCSPPESDRAGRSRKAPSPTRFSAWSARSSRRRPAACDRPARAPGERCSRPRGAAGTAAGRPSPGRRRSQQLARSRCTRRPRAAGAAAWSCPSRWRRRRRSTRRRDAQRGVANRPDRAERHRGIAQRDQGRRAARAVIAARPPAGRCRSGPGRSRR